MRRCQFCPQFTVYEGEETAKTRKAAFSLVFFQVESVIIFHKAAIGRALKHSGLSNLRLAIL